MYYSSGNYEAYATAKKPEGVDKKSAYIVGTGLAGLSAGCFLVRDAQMEGKNIHIYESMVLPGGSCDGVYDATRGFVMRGGREMDNHFECMWDLFRSIPSIETEGISVFEEYYWLNKDDPNFSLCRITEKQGQDAHSDRKYGMTPGAATQLLKLFMTPNKDLEDVKIDDVFDDEFYATNFWIYWQTMFAFEKWHSALEMKLYLQRFIHHIDGLPDLSALRFTKYNQYDSMILPMVKYLKDHGASVECGVVVNNVEFDIKPGKKVAKGIDLTRNGRKEHIKLTENDFVFVTNGSQGDCSVYGDQNTAPVVAIKDGEGVSWDLWRNIAKQDPSFGHPDKFCQCIKETNWESATITTLDNKVLPYIEKICKRDPLSGKTVTGGIVTAKDSSWLLSWTINRQTQFKEQRKDQCIVWIYGLNCYGVKGDYIKKQMANCTGKELCEEWMYHIGVPEKDIEELATKSCNTVPVMMPYVTTFFEPRKAGDRPDVVPKDCVNLAFLGQFAETPRDTVFTTEYSIRTGMEAVYTLLNVDRGVPEVWPSVYDVRCLLEATNKLMDGRKPLEVFLPVVLPILSVVKDKIDNNVVTDLLKKYNMI